MTGKKAKYRTDNKWMEGPIQDGCSEIYLEAGKIEVNMLKDIAEIGPITVDMLNKTLATERGLSFRKRRLSRSSLSSR